MAHEKNAARTGIQGIFAADLLASRLKVGVHGQRTQSLMARALRERDVDVVVVGGGIAGLSAAYALSKSKASFRLIESQPRWGGVIQTEMADGFVLEAGPEMLLGHKPEALNLCHELGLGEHIVAGNPVRHSTYVAHGGRLHSLPQGMTLGIPTRLAPLVSSRLFSWRGKLRMALDVLIPATRESDLSVGRFVTRRLGREALERLADPLLAGIHSADPQTLSMRSTFPTLMELESKHGSLIRGMWAAHPGGSMFYSLRNGLGEMVEALVARLPPDRLSLASPVVSTAYEDHAFVLEMVDRPPLRARSLIIATPAHETARLLAKLSPQASAALAEIPFASTATVHLAYRRDAVGHALDSYGLLLPRTEALRTLACTFCSTKFPGRAPDGYVLLKAYIGGARDTDILSLDDQAIVNTVIGDLSPLLHLSGAPELTRVHRWPFAAPQMLVGHGSQVASMTSRVAEIPGLFLTGSGLRGSGIAHCVADGRSVAAAASTWAISCGLATSDAPSRPAQPGRGTGP